MLIRLSIAAFLALATAAPALAEIEVHDAYARSSNPVAGAAFMTIHNHGGPDDRLIAARSDAAARVELHTHIEDAAGVMRMVEVKDGFALPSGGELALARGGAHVMFMGLTAPFENGATVPLTLVFETAGEITLDVVVDNDRKDMGPHGASH